MTPNVSAAMGLGQLIKFQKFLNKRRELIVVIEKI